MKNKFTSKALYISLALSTLSLASLRAASVQWTGGTSTSWNNSANWTTVGSGTHAVPTSSDDVEILGTATNQPTLNISGTTTINSLTIDDNALLTCASGNDLTVSGNVDIISTGSYGELVMNGNTVRIGGSLTGTGTVDASNNSSVLYLAGDMSIGNFVQGNGGTSKVVMDGSSAQHISNFYEFNNLEVDNTSGVTMDAGIEVDQDLTGSGALSAGANDLYFLGTNMSISTFNAGTGTVHLWRSNANYSLTGVQNISSYTFYNIDNYNNETDLVGGVTVSNNLDFQTGDVVLGTHNLTISSGASITNAAISKGYIVTNSSGVLVMEAPTSGITYPVGHSTAEYNPIFLTPNATTTCDVSVMDHLYDKNGSQVTDYAVDATWIVRPHANATFNVQTQWTNGGSGGTLVDFNGNAMDPNQELGTHFDRTNSYLSYRTTGYTGSGSWSPIGVATSASGSDPYSLAATTTLSMSGSGATTYYIATGTDGTSSFSPLPVTFSYFKAAYTNGNGVLNWQTASEINNSRFEVERSMNGINWETVGQVQGHGTTQDVNNYTFTDKLAGVVPGVVYYRLKQVDYNGSFSYSAIRSIKMSANAVVDMQVYPNPATDVLNINYTSSAANSMIRIADMNGMEMYSEKISETGNIHRQISLLAYPAGTYFVQVIANDNLTTNLIIKK